MSINSLSRSGSLLFKKSLRAAFSSKNSKPLQKLLIHSQSSKWTPQNEGRFIQLLRKSKFLNKFEYEKKWDTVISSRLLEQISKCFTRFISLRELKFTLFGCSSVSTKASMRLAKALSRSKQLENISLDLVGCNQISLTGLQYLISRIFRQEFLKKITLTLSNMKCLRETPAFLDFYNTLGKLKNVEELHLLMTNAIFDDTMIQNLSRGISKLNNLKVLELGFGNCNMKNADVFELGNVLSVLTNLKTLSLELWSCVNIDDEGVFNLAKGLGNLACLKKFELNLSRCSEITDQGFIAIFKAIRKMKELERLDLLFFTTKLSNYGLFDLRQMLLDMNTLEAIELNIGGCGLREEDVEYLEQTFLNRPAFKDKIKINS